MNSVQHWGENPWGDWEFSIKDVMLNKRKYPRFPKSRRFLIGWKFEIFGTEQQVPQLGGKVPY